MWILQNFGPCFRSHLEFCWHRWYKHLWVWWSSLSCVFATYVSYRNETNSKLIFLSYHCLFHFAHNVHRFCQCDISICPTHKFLNAYFFTMHVLKTMQIEWMFCFLKAVARFKIIYLANDSIISLNWCVQITSAIVWHTLALAEHRKILCQLILTNHQNKQHGHLFIIWSRFMS